VKSQAVPSQLVLAAPVGRGQALHEVAPHEFTLLFAAQTPLQACVPAAHWPSQAAVLSMQAPLHAFLLAGQLAPHAPCVQVALPPDGTGHGSQELPQVSGLVSLTQRPLQAWLPLLQRRVQVPPTHWGAPAPPGSVGQAMQALPQAVASSSRAQRSPQR
jgi:hypothetical protein